MELIRGRSSQIFRDRAAAQWTKHTNPGASSRRSGQLHGGGRADQRCLPVSPVFRRKAPFQRAGNLALPRRRFHRTCRLSCDSRRRRAARHRRRRPLRRIRAFEGRSRFRGRRSISGPRNRRGAAASPYHCCSAGWSQAINRRSLAGECRHVEGVLSKWVAGYHEARAARGSYHYAAVLTCSMRRDGQPKLGYRAGNTGLRA